ncbi:MAG: hypothetical protein U0794_15670 [Isosphaeraceae bacterium]
MARHLARSLGRPVVLDKAGMDRLDVRSDDTVQLVLDGARLKTGLRLLLDQLDMTYRVETEDNLLILTDSVGSQEPTDRILAELESLHHDVHALQDVVEDLRAAMGLDPEEGARMRKPTIIEEVPGGVAPKPEEHPPVERPRTNDGKSRPGV